MKNTQRTSPKRILIVIVSLCMLVVMAGFYTDISPDTLLKKYIQRTISIGLQNSTNVNNSANAPKTTNVTNSQNTPNATNVKVSPKAPNATNVTNSPKTPNATNVTNSPKPPNSTSVTNSPNTPIANSLNASDYYVTCSNYSNRQKRGLGNQMFNFAAAVYVAELTGREIVHSKAHKAKHLDEVFDLDVKRDHVCPCYTFTEKWISYDVRIDEMLTDTAVMQKRTIILDGYYQSWKYLRLINERIRKLFKFKQRYTDFARKTFKSNFPSGWTNGFIRVGVHNRRGDFAVSAKSSGFATAPESYFRNAMAYFTDRYDQVQFFVASQDKPWTNQHIFSNSTSGNVSVVYLFDNLPGEDMALLSMCDHVIVSSGSFGWWSAWLAKGTTIYYAKYPTPNSLLSSAMKISDYYPPHWIPME